MARGAKYVSTTYIRRITFEVYQTAYRTTYMYISSNSTLVSIRDAPYCNLRYPRIVTRYRASVVVYRRINYKYII